MKFIARAPYFCNISSIWQLLKSTHNVMKRKAREVYSSDLSRQCKKVIKKTCPWEKRLIQNCTVRQRLSPSTWGISKDIKVRDEGVVKEESIKHPDQTRNHISKASVLWFLAALQTKTTSKGWHQTRMVLWFHTVLKKQVKQFNVYQIQKNKKGTSLLKWNVSNQKKMLPLVLS